MASLNYVKHKLEEAGLEAIVEGRTILVEDAELGFTRRHDGVKGISDFCRETLEEYEEACRELFQEAETPSSLDLSDEGLEAMEAYITAADEPLVEEEPIPMFNFVEAFLEFLGRSTAPAADPPPAPPIKAHIPDSEQLDLARELNAKIYPESAKEITQALENDLQDKGGIPNPADYIRDKKLEVAMTEAVVILEVGQRFMAPKGYKIKEVRPGRETPIFYGSIFKGRKLNNELKGSKFSLIPRS